MRQPGHWMLWGAGVGVAAGAVALIVRRGRARRLALASQVDNVTRRAVEQLGVPAESRFISVSEAGGVRLHVVIAGPPDGPLAVLLHGFPECWYSWRHQIAALAHAGYRVAAPDQRGYNLSDRPAGVQSYQIDRLTADVYGLVRALGRARAVIVGHDWGGVVAWRFAMDYPDVVDRLVVMNAPHPVAFARELRRSWAQRVKSWYVAFFQLPWLPEALLSLSPMSSARLFFRRTVVRPSAFSEADLQVMATALAQPGALQAMIHWYRASFRFAPARRTQAIQAPTLLIWAEDDVALDKSLTYGLEKRVSNLAVHYIPHCGHWVQNEAPDEVNAQMLAFLGTPSL
jgi:pimeloyl-ACP methyl ester carboxylesterase